MLLYHYTSFFALPSILREGLTRGTAAECPVVGPNFTTSQNPSAQTWCRGSCLNKTKVRLTVDVPQPNLARQVDLWNRHRIARGRRRLLDPLGQAKFWFVYLGKLPPESIRAVEVFEAGDYRPIGGEELTALCGRIGAETANLVVVDMGDGSRAILGADSWLLDGEFPVPLAVAEAS